MAKKPIVIPIKSEGRIPRDAEGDPRFSSIQAILQVYSEEQLVEGFNRYLRYTEFNLVTNRKYAQRRQEQTTALHQVGRELYPGRSWGSLLPHEVDRVGTVFRKRREAQELQEKEDKE